MEKEKLYRIKLGNLKPDDHFLLQGLSYVVNDNSEDVMGVTRHETPDLKEQYFSLPMDLEVMVHKDVFMRSGRDISIDDIFVTYLSICIFWTGKGNNQGRFCNHNTSYHKDCTADNCPFIRSIIDKTQEH